jgi:fructose-bisphosphate aldolase, class I
MNTTALIETAQAMITPGKGLLAMDESIGTCDKRFASADIPQTLAMRRAYRELLLTTPDLGTCISGVILHDETIRQATTDGIPFIKLARDAGILVGIKVDAGTSDFAAHPGEKVTEGLDGLRDRLLSYVAMGAHFTKWRAVIAVDKAERPSRSCIEANAHALARYAALSQEAGLVPIVEPEVLMDGQHSQERCQEVSEAVLRCVFDQLTRQSVVLEAMILKPNMVLAGLTCATQNTATEIADATVQCLLRVVPAAVPGMMFLSGGQSGELASSRLNAMHLRDAPLKPMASTSRHTLPWQLSFSFARAIQYPALEIWAGKEANKAAAQQALLHRARCNSAALKGDYDAALENR